MTNLLIRIRILINGRFCWRADDGTVEHEILSWRDRWALFGVHSYNWWWVRRFGDRPCGCTNNPITRRQVLICQEHAWGCKQ